MADIIADGARLPFTEAIKFFEQKVNMPSGHWADVYGEAHARAFAVAGAASDALLADFRAAVDRAIRDGTTLVQFRDEFDSIVKLHGWKHTGTPGWRAAIIYDTNTSMAYSAGEYEQLQQVRHAFPYWRYVHGLHGTPQRPRPQHQAWNGLVLRCDDPFWDTHFPPNGWRCTCGVEAVSHEELLDAGKTGPDVAPPLKTRPWRNPRTGELVQVPDGIDPGFDYNPGKMWRQPVGPAEVAPLARDLSPVTGRDVATPAGTIPAVPVTDVGPVIVDEGAPERTHPISRPSARTAPIRQTTNTWLNDQIRTQKADGTMRIVGRLPDAVHTDAGAPREILVTSRVIAHLMRETKQTAGKAIPLADIEHLQAHLARPDAVFRQKGGNLLFVWRSSGLRLGLFAKVAVALNAKLSKGRDPLTTNIVRTAGVVDEGTLRGSDYTLLDGSL
jgi:hypothetical protein